MIHIAIVEDEEMYRKQIMEYIRRYEEENGSSFKLSIYEDGEDIVDNYQGDYDIIFLDIQMRFMDGISASKRIREMDPEVIIIFVTNMIQYAVRGYEVDAMDYLVKPVEYFSLSQKIKKAVSRIERKSDLYIWIPMEEGIKKVELSHVYYIESKGHQLVYQTDSGVYSSRGTLKELEKTLTPYHFFRCHKGYLINLAQVEGIQGECCMVNKTAIPVSRGKLKDLMNQLMRSMNVG